MGLDIAELEHTFIQSPIAFPVYLACIVRLPGWPIDAGPGSRAFWLFTAFLSESKRGVIWPIRPPNALTRRIIASVSRDIGISDSNTVEVTKIA